MANTAGGYAPQWLKESDVKKWLRLNDQDATDNDLIRAVSAMAEPYVERCRPEFWLLPPTPPLVLEVAVESGQPVVDLTGQPDLLPRAILALASGEAWPGDRYAVGLGRVDDPAVSGGTLTLPLAFSGTDQPVYAWTLQAWADMAQPLTLTVPAGGNVVEIERLNYREYFPDAETYQGAVMYAAREYRRRNSPAGIETFGEVTSFVARFDPDIDRALQTGAWARPVIA